jgi:hypothetical protein
VGQIVPALLTFGVERGWVKTRNRSKWWIPIHTDSLLSLLPFSKGTGEESPTQSSVLVSSLGDPSSASSVLPCPAHRSCQQHTSGSLQWWGHLWKWL